MCLVIDTCCLSAVFNTKNSAHPEFKPVLQWLKSKYGRVIYGGTKYRRELGTAKKYLGILAELNRLGRVIELDDIEVDRIQSVVKAMEPDPNFDDPHIVAIAIVSRCKIVCTNDSKAHPFIRQTRFYPRNMSRPRIYTGLRNKNSLCDRNIANICKS